jgi:hypothetical protein
MLYILDEIRAKIKEGVEGIGKQSIIDYKPDPSKLTTLPVISIYDTGFTFEKIGIGEGMGITKEESQEEYSGDGVRTKFKLKNSAIRPLISVEAPTGNKLTEIEEYSVDYFNGEVRFKTAPPKAQKGKANVLITYAVAKNAGEMKGIRLKIVCNLDIWAKSLTQCDTITMDVIKSMLFAEDLLSSKHINIKPLSGMNLTVMMDGKLKDAKGRRLVYLAESDIKFETKVSQIRKIEISEREWDERRFRHKYVSK